MVEKNCSKVVHSGWKITLIFGFGLACNGESSTKEVSKVEEEEAVEELAVEEEVEEAKTKEEPEIGSKENPYLINESITIKVTIPRQYVRKKVIPFV